MPLSDCVCVVCGYPTEAVYESVVDEDGVENEYMEVGERCGMCGSDTTFALGRTVEG